ncbi:MAG: phosphodiester glycosidase family protein, partial [Cyanobacteriota bacterium]|nr:phosphodiester glycosidase family protein [Cyanobacteriota bacterium]
PASVPEDGPNNLIYTFSRSGPTTNPLTVNYSTGGTATPGSDFTGIVGTPASITFAAGSATATVTIDPTTDSAVEPDETVALSLAAGSGYTIGTTTAVVGTIANDDVPPPPVVPVVTLAISPASVPEDGPNNLIYTFSRSGPTTNPLTVNYSTGGTATPGSDYTGLPGTPASITFAAGSATATVTIDPTNDSAVEPDETVALSLASGSGYTIGTTTAVVGTITNDDGVVPPTPGAWTYDWASASTLGNIPSILKASVALPSPRAGEAPLALTALRVDLRDPAIQLTSTGRRSDWANNTIETTSETSRQYISRSRTSGLPIVAAMNTAPFDLDLANQLLSVPTNIRGFAVSDGVLVSSTDYNTDTFKSTFLYDPVTGARIQTLPSSLPAASAGVSYPAPAAEVALASTLKVATSGFGIVLNNGVVSGDQLLQNARSALGLTADGRYLTMLTVDRVFNPAQPSGWQGATDHDVGTILKGFGSTMGINVDGGGSTQLAWWNPTNNQAELLNNPGFERYVGASLGVAYQPI